MIHLTLTGPMAGTPLCGTHKHHAKQSGDTFIHAIYSRSVRQNQREQVCPRCLSTWEAEEYDVEWAASIEIDDTPTQEEEEFFIPWNV